MAKVKKSAGLTGERNVKARRTSRAPGKSSKSNKARRTTKARTPMTTSSATRKSTRNATTKSSKDRPAPIVTVAVKELDPQRKCGLGTSVQFLYRVDESVDGRSTPHLVFFDRHGWYCEHGRACPAVTHARKYNGQMARVS